MRGGVGNVLMKSVRDGLCRGTGVMTVEQKEGYGKVGRVIVVSEGEGRYFVHRGRLCWS